MDTSKYIEEFKALEKDLMSGSLSAKELMEKSKRHAFLKPIIEKENEINAVLSAIESDKEMIKDGSDKEMAALAAEELAEMEAKLPQLQQELRVLVIPPDPNDSKSIYLEIRPGAGGEESALFAAELLRVYQHFADAKGWKTELLEFTPTGLKGCKYVSMFIKGDGAYSWLRDEGFTFGGYHGNYGCWWAHVNITRKQFAYGMPGVCLALPIGDHAITIEEFKTIYNIYKKYIGKDVFVFHEKRFDYCPEVE